MLQQSNVLNGKHGSRWLLLLLPCTVAPQWGFSEFMALVCGANYGVNVWDVVVDLCSRM